MDNNSTSNSLIGFPIKLEMESKSGCFIFSSDYPDTPNISASKGSLPETIRDFICNIFAQGERITLRIVLEDKHSVISIISGNKDFKIPRALINPLILEGLCAPLSPNDNQLAIA